MLSGYMERKSHTRTFRRQRIVAKQNCLEMKSAILQSSPQFKNNNFGPCQPTADLTPTYPQIEVKDHPASLGVCCHHFQCPSHCSVSRKEITTINQQVSILAIDNDSINFLKIAFPSGQHQFHIPQHEFKAATLEPCYHEAGTEADKPQ